MGYDPYVSNRIRRQPHNTSGVLGLISPGEVVQILDGPVCAEGAIWWQVESVRKPLKGWTVEGDVDGYWLFPTSETSSSRIPKPRGQVCLAEDPEFCSFTRQVERWIIRGDIESLLEHSRKVSCDLTPPPTGEPSTSEDEGCIFWGIPESGLSAIPKSQVIPAWESYADPGRRPTYLLLPPFRDQELPGDLPQSPALLVQTADPFWDWLLFLDKAGGEWQIGAFLMLPKNPVEELHLSDQALPWP